MKNILDIGFIKDNPNLIQDTMEFVIRRRRNHVFSGQNGKKPIKVIPKKINKDTFKHRNIRKTNVI